MGPVAHGRRDRARGRRGAGRDGGPPPSPELDILVSPPEPLDATPAAVARRLADRGEELLRTGQAAAAAMLLRRALTFAPGDARILALLGEPGSGPSEGSA